MQTEIIKAKLNQSKGSWRAVAKSADVSYSWLTKFATGRILNPGVQTLAKLSAALGLK